MTIEPGGIRVLVVDDEAPARQRLTDLLRPTPWIAAVLEASDGRMAAAMILDQRPDLVFLDVQMPELDGLGVIEEVIETIGADPMPLTVFVTAYDQHAIRAFESNALDYLLKPFSDERFEATLARARSRLDERQLREFGHIVLQLIATRPAGDPRVDQRLDQRLDRLVVKSAGATQLVRLADIDWIEAAGVYVNLHVAGAELLYRAALAELADRLDPARFIRVHRSAIVNLDSIVRLEPASHGEFEVVLKHGGRTRVSRTYRAALERRLGQSL